MSAPNPSNHSTTRPERLELQRLVKLVEDKHALANEFLKWRWQIPFLKVKDPESVKAYSRIAARLTELEYYLTQPDVEGPFSVAEMLVSRIDRRLRREDSWDVAEQMKILLLYFSPQARLSSLLNIERVHDSQKRPQSAGEAPYGASVTWNSTFDSEELNRLCREVTGSELKSANDQTIWRQAAIERLAMLYELRIDDWRHTRALTQLRANYLTAIALVLAVLLVAVALSHRNGGGRVDLLLTAMATGALGSVLTGVFKLRDEMMGIRQLRLYAPVLWALPVVGATAATVLFVILDADLVSLGQSRHGDLRWPHYAAFGFLAGFSEVFFLGVVKRLAGAPTPADENPPRAASARTSGGDHP